MKTKWILQDNIHRNEVHKMARIMKDNNVRR